MLARRGTDSGEDMAKSLADVERKTGGAWGAEGKTKPEKNFKEKLIFPLT